MFGVNRSYVSGFAHWMKEESTSHPQWQAQQLESRALWWDRKIDKKEMAALSAGEIQQKAYPYDVNFCPVDSA